MVKIVGGVCVCVSLRSDQVAQGFIHFSSGFENQGEETSKDKDCRASGKHVPLLDCCSLGEKVFSYIQSEPLGFQFVHCFLSSLHLQLQVSLLKVPTTFIWISQ